MLSLRHQRSVKRILEEIVSHALSCMNVMIRSFSALMPSDRVETAAQSVSFNAPLKLLSLHIQHNYIKSRRKSVRHCTAARQTSCSLRTFTITLYLSCFALICPLLVLIGSAFGFVRYLEQVFLLTWDLFLITGTKKCKIRRCHLFYFFFLYFSGKLLFKFWVWDV